MWTLASLIPVLEMESIIGMSSSEVRGVDALMRPTIIPVVAFHNNGLRAHIVALESKVVGCDKPIMSNEFVEVSCDSSIVAYAVSRESSQVILESTKATVELFEYDCLRFDFTYLLSDNLLSKLLDNNKALLDNFDLLGVANEFVFFFHNNLFEVVAREVVFPVPIVKAVKGLVSAPAME